MPRRYPKAMADASKLLSRAGGAVSLMVTRADAPAWNAGRAARVNGLHGDTGRKGSERPVGGVSGGAGMTTPTDAGRRVRAREGVTYAWGCGGFMWGQNAGAFKTCVEILKMLPRAGAQGRRGEGRGQGRRLPAVTPDNCQQLSDNR